MTEQETAIREAESTLKTEKAERLKKQIYDFLKAEYDEIESIDSQINDLKERKRIHEENVKNVKAGNLEAIQKRQKAVGIPITWKGTTTYNPYWYNNWLAGVVVTTSSGKRYIF